jgi:hypothetical protein
MSNIIQGPQLRQLVFGTKITRAAAALPQSTTGHLFTVTGGRVIITAFMGKVTTAIQAQATTLQLTATPTSGTAVNLNLVTASDVNAKEIGASVSLDIPANKLLITNAGSNQLGPLTPVMVSTGTIDLTTVASSTGQMQWDLFYLPLDDGAAVAAA